MKKIVKQVVGIDVAQKELVVCLGRLEEDFTAQLVAHKTFANTEQGFAGLLLWLRKLSDAAVPVRFVMEATGVYHEALAYYLDEQGQALSIVLPNKISHYMRTLETKTTTDKTASQAITLFGLERKLEAWQRPKDLFKELRQLTREREQLVAERTVLKNQLHAEEAEAAPHAKSRRRLQARIKILDEQEKEIKAEIALLIKGDEQVRALVALVCTLPGVGLLTAAIVLAETNGFELTRNRRQLASYAGFDVKEKQSGTSVKGKPHISKKGNKYLRKAMHLPALAALRHDERFKALFARLVARHGIKMKAVVAVQRRLLELMFTLFKTGNPYDPAYESGQNKEAKPCREAAGKQLQEVV